MISVIVRCWPRLFTGINGISFEAIEMIQEKKLRQQFPRLYLYLFVRPQVAMRSVSPGKELHPPGSYPIIDMLPSESPIGWIERLRK